MANKKVYINTIAQIAGKVSTALISIVLIKILTNYLDLEGYGLYAKIYNYLSIFSVIADLGLYTVSVREISANKDRPERVRHIAGNILALRTILGGVIIAVSLGLAAFLPGYDNRIALAGVGIAGVFTLFGLMNSSILSLLQAHLRTEFSFVSVTIGKITNLLAVLFTVFLLFPKPLDIGMLWGIERETLAFIAIMLSGLIGNIVMTGLLYGYSRKVEKIRFIFDPIYLK